MPPLPGPRRFPRPRLVISRCITFDPVRYDGSTIPSELAERMKRFVDFIPVCPEVGIGLGVPRNPVRIVRSKGGDRLIQPATGLDLTEEMVRFAREFLDGLPPVDGFILKDKSPSSAKAGAKVFPDAGSPSPVGRRPGLFGREVIARFGRFPIEDEGRLRSARVRNHFLTAVFTLARFREAKEQGKLRDLVRFHAENQLLLMAASERAMRAMGRVVANREGKAPREVFALYEDLLLSALMRHPGVAAKIRILTWAGDYFSGSLTVREKEAFQAALMRYQEGYSTVSGPRKLVVSWIARFGGRDLETPEFPEKKPGEPGVWKLNPGDQSFFFPYPEELNLQEDGIRRRGRDSS